MNWSRRGGLHSHLGSKWSRVLVVRRHRLLTKSSKSRVTELHRRFLLERQRPAIARMRRKKAKAPDSYRRLKKLRAADCPRYMNVPLPASNHGWVAAVKEHSVWGLRIIVESQLSLWHDSSSPSILKSGGRAGIQTRICSFAR